MFISSHVLCEVNAINLPGEGTPFTITTTIEIRPDSTQVDIVSRISGVNNPWAIW